MIDYDELDTLEEVDKLLCEPEEHWTTPPTTHLGKLLVHMLRELRQILEDETGL